MLVYDDEIFVRQKSILNGYVRFAKGRFFIENNTYFIELNGESPFKDYHDSKSRFTGIVEIDEPGAYEYYELTILPNPDMTEFEVIEDNEFLLFKRFLIKHEAEKLEKGLKINETKKNIKKKI